MSIRPLWMKLFICFALCTIATFFSSGAVQAASSSSPEGIQVYQKHLPPEHKQQLADDITRYRNADNLWDVLREEFTLPHYEENQAVQERVEWFMNNQDFLLRAASRAAPYLHYILQQVRKKHLPAELVLLPIVESGYNPFAVSNVGATGIWQMMPATASGLGVKQDWWYDGRRDVISSTRGALNYLAYLQSFFDGNWLLAIAAYNTGEGNILSAMKRNMRDGLDTDFWSLPVAQETRDYVPSLLALAIIISNPDQYPVYFPPVRNAPYLAQVDVGSQINLKYAAELAGISYNKMQQLNPGFNHASTSSRGPYKLVLPIENVEQFTENLTRTPLNRQIDWQHYRVKSGDTLASIAKKHSTTVAAIKKLNHLSKKSVRRGADLLLPNQAQTNKVVAEKETKKPFSLKTFIIKSKYAQSEEEASEQLASNENGHYALQPGDTIYMVREHDTLDSIARRFHINRQALQAVNQLSTAKVKPGLQIIIPTHTTMLANASNSSEVIYEVKRGDTVEKIAKKFRTNAAAIRLANFVDNSSLSEGEKLVIPPRVQS